MRRHVPHLNLSSDHCHTYRLISVSCLSAEMPRKIFQRAEIKRTGLYQERGSCLTLRKAEMYN